MPKDKFARMAFAKVYQSAPAQDASLTALSNRLALIEGELTPSRLEACENTIETLQNQISSLEQTIAKMMLHTHKYDDSGTTKTTQAPTL